MADKKQDSEFAEDQAPWRPGETDVDVELSEEANGNSSEIDQEEFKKVVETVSQTAGDDSDIEEDEVAEETESNDIAKVNKEVEPDIEITTTSVIEAVLFCSDEPITPKKLVEIVGTGSVKDIRSIVDELNEKYEQMNCAFRIEGIAGGYQMLTQPAYNTWLRKLLKVRSETKLSPAALETLAIVAYKQPIIRVEIEAIRGVAVGEMLRQLSEKGLAKIVGRAEELGRPLLYGTTKKFLEVFGLNSLKDLPTVEDLKNPD